jgi:hypothetical protein
MGRLLTSGIANTNSPVMIMGTTADRPTAVTAGVTFFNRTSNQLEIYNGTDWHVVGDYQRILITTSSAAVSNRSYWVNTTAGAITLTLPATPVIGDFVKITDLAGTFGTNACTVARNGQNIMRTADDMTVNTNGASIRMVFYDTARGWLLESI